MSQKVKVTSKEDGAVISVDGFDIIITVKPSVAIPQEGAPIQIPLRITVESVRSKLSEHLEELDVSEEVEDIVIKPKGFLGRDKFASIAAIVEEMGGRYISEGKESRFLIPKG